MKTTMRRLISTTLLLATVAVAGAVIGGVGIGTAATQARPTNQSPPTVTGTAQVGSTLTAKEGTWAGSPTTFAYVWRRCDTDGGSCADISGATDKTYALKAVDQGNTLRIRVTAGNAEGRTTATSVPTAVVRPAETTPPPAAGCTGNGTVPIAQVKPPERLLIAGQQVSPGVVTGQTQEIVARFRVTCSGKPVQGALVFVTAVPYNMFSVPPEAQTGADGWAELRMNRQRGFPATPRQQLLVMFVRGREPGGNLLGGVSSRRLISFPVRLGR